MLQTQRQRIEAAKVAELEEQRKLTVRRLIDDWRATDLQPRVRADGKRIGRVDGGQYVFEQFTRYVFPSIGNTVRISVHRGRGFRLMVDGISA